MRAPGFVVLARGPAPAGADGERPPATRVGVVASKRLGGAVQRNRAKRRLRELLRHRLDELPPGLVVVVIAQAPLLRRAFADLQRDMDRVTRDLARLARRPAPP